MTDAPAPGPIDHVVEAERIAGARHERRTLDPISAGRTAFTLDDAYRIQAELTRRRLERGESRIGWKLGYTSQAMRHQMGVDTANFGPLTDAMLVASGDDVAGRFTQPRVEPEVALRFARDVEPGADRVAVLDAVGSAHAALEIVDSVWTDYRFRIEDNTADGSSAAGVVIGAEIDLQRIADVEVRLLLDGTPVGHGWGRDASGHPADGVVWLVEELAARGERLVAGSIVITGGLTAAAALAPGSEICGAFDGVIGACVRHGRTSLD